MGMHVLDQFIAGLPEEPKLLEETTIRLAEEVDLPRFNQLLAKEHYLQNPGSGPEPLTNGWLPPRFLRRSCPRIW
jgi:hypothetical protein